MDAAKIEDYMRDIDRSLLRENLKLTPAQRLEKFVKFRRFTSELRRAGESCTPRIFGTHRQLCHSRGTKKRFAQV
jgi:hypothetical protein